MYEIVPKSESCECSDGTFGVLVGVGIIYKVAILATDMAKASIKKGKIFLLIISLIIAGFFIYSFISLNLAETFVNSISKSLFGDYRFTGLFAYSLLLFLMLYFFIFFSYVIGWIDNKFFGAKYPNNLYSIIMFSAMIFVLFVGIVGYGEVYNQKDFSFVLRDSNGTIQGNISCEGRSPVILQGHKVDCIVYPILENLTAQIYYTYDNQSVGQESISNLTFLAPYEPLHYVRIYVKGYNPSGEHVSLDVGNEYFFPNIRDYREDGINFLKFVFILLGVVFITIPTATYYIRKIVRNEP